MRERQSWSSFRQVFGSLRWQAWAFWVLFSLGLAIFSSLLLKWTVEPGDNLTRQVYASLVATFAGLLLFWIFLCLLKTSWIQRNLSPFYDTFTKSHFITAAVLSVIATLVVLLFMSRLDPELFVANLFVETPGGLFNFVVAVFTIAGVYITLRSILDIRQTITTFSQLVDRLCWIIQTTQEDDQLRCLTYTPAVGSIALPKRNWDRLYSILKREHAKISIVCLSEADIHKFHSIFKGRVTERDKIDDAIIDEADQKAVSLLALFKVSGTPPIFRSEVQMPGYYMFANRSRGIVASPLFMPLPAHGLTEAQIMRLPSVQMFGFETTDPTIVQAIHKTLDLYSEERAKLAGADEIGSALKLASAGSRS